MKERRTLVDEARRLVPALRERAGETNQLRRLPDVTWKDLIETGLLRGLQPARWGGGEVHPKEFYSAVIEVARVEGSTGWVLGVIGVHPWQTALFPKETQEEMWSEDPTVMNSSSYAPTGKAEKVSGGYRLSGRWSFSSGCDHCQWVCLGAILGTAEVEGREVPDFRFFLLPRKDYKIDDNWFVAGMAGTGSKDIIVADAFVPEHRSQSRWDYMLGRPLPGWELNPSPLYRLPWIVVFVSTLTASTLGAALGFLDAWTEISRTRKSGFGLSVKEDPYTQKLLAEASYTINTAILRLQHDSDEMMDAGRAGEPFPPKRQAALWYNACRSAQLAVQAVDRLFEASGGRAIFFNHPLQRRYQDVKAMMGHVGLKPDVPARMYGAMEFGLSALDFLV
jgi:3-hydroxy-9,10-secoandrosta-1,3,5(10)-triene-9,17-dione monooxygenase